MSLLADTLLLGYTPIPYFPARIKSSATLLKLLNVPCKTTNPFWLSNESRLDYLYQDFCVNARKLKARMHPARGGDVEQFTRFNKHCDMVARAFCAHGAGPRMPAEVYVEKKKNSYIRSDARRRFILKNVKHKRH